MSDIAAGNAVERLSRVPVPIAPAGLKPRMGGAYVRSVCAQAGVGFTEVSGEEDLIAVDALVTLKQVEVRVQIKCTSQFSIGDNPLSWPLETRWVEKWRESLGPVFLVLVVVDPQTQNWVIPEANGTRLVAGAWWAQVDGLSEGTRTLTNIHKQRLTNETFATWRTLYLEKVRREILGEGFE